MQVRMTKFHAALAASALTTLTLPALAGTAAAIDRVPTDAPVVIGINHMRSFLADVDQINIMMGDDASAELMMGVMMIRGMDGLDLDGSAAFVVFPDAENQDDEHAHHDGHGHDHAHGEEDNDGDTMIAIVPVSDFGALTHNQEAVNGLVKYPLPENKTGYFRDIGDGFALFGDDAEAVAEFDAAKGRMEANNSLIGTAGQGIAASSDIFVYLNLLQLDESIDNAKEGMEQQGAMVGMMGGEQAQAGFDSFLDIFDSIAEEGQAFIGGMNFDATTGIAFDVGMQFKPDSAAAAYMNNKNPNARQYLRHIPSMKYFMASTMDLSGDGIKQLMSDVMGFAAQNDEAGMMKGMNFLDMIKDTKGGAQIMGATNPMGMTGVLSNIVNYFESDDNGALIKEVEKMYNAMNGQQLPGMSVTTSFDSKGTKIEETTAYSYSMRYSVDQAAMGNNMGGMGGMMNPQMINQIMFGPNLGPAGYIGEAGDGVVQTMSTDQDFYARAVWAARGEGTLGTTDIVMSSASHLQKNTVLELYFGADHTLNTVGPMLMMFGIVPEFEQLAPHAPIAMGFTADGGGATMRTWLPMEVLGTVMELIPEGAMDQLPGRNNDDTMDF